MVHDFFAVFFFSLLGVLFLNVLVVVSESFDLGLNSFQFRCHSCELPSVVSDFSLDAACVDRSCAKVLGLQVNVRKVKLVALVGKFSRSLD